MNNLSASWKRGFDVAKAARLHSNGVRPGEKLGAALFSGPILVSIGFNTYDKTHPAASNKKFNRCIHAEHACLIRRQYHADKDLVMYVYRETSTHKGVVTPSISKPCESCMQLLSLAGVKRVRYFNLLGEVEELKP
ncbi:MAG: hypothetical protein ACRYGG_00870 [Janthinobacterium lividum]